MNIENIGIKKSLDLKLAETIHPLLVEFRANVIGAPISMYPTDHAPYRGRDESAEAYDERLIRAEESALEKWKITLEQMIYSFGKIVNQSDWQWEYDPLQKAKVQEGLELFGKHFRSLWG